MRCECEKEDEGILNINFYLKSCDCLLSIKLLNNI